MFRQITLAVFLLAGVAGKAQMNVFSVRVTVQDSVNGQYLENATVSLLRIPGGTIVYQRRSEKKDLVFSNLPPGLYRLVTSFLGYATDTLFITFTPQQAGQQMPAGNSAKNVRVLLRQSAKDLMQVIVNAEIPPGTVKNDTVAFNAAAFPTRPNATVEDLLRKLPGFEIDQDGNITLQGQKVDKIYLDGKEFYLNDPRTATKTLPADLVDQIETFDSETDQARLSGIREVTGNKSLNIKLKKNRKKLPFGTVYSATGTGAQAPGSTGSESHPTIDPLQKATQYYSVGGSGTQIADTWWSANLNLNNLNDQFTGSDNENGPGNGGIQTVKTAQFDFQNKQDGPFSLLFDGSANSQKTILSEVSQLQTFLSDSSLLQNSTSRSQSDNKSYHGIVLLQYHIDSLTSISARTSFQYSLADNLTADTVSIATLKKNTEFISSQGLIANNIQTSGTALSNTVDLLRRWPRLGRSLLIDLSERFQDNRQTQKLFNMVHAFDSADFLLSQTVTNQNALQFDKTANYGVSFLYTEPIRPFQVLDFAYRMNWIPSHSDHVAYDYDSSNAKYDIPDTLTTNHFISTSTTQQFSLALNSVWGKWRSQLGASVQATDFVNRNVTPGTSIDIVQLVWLPKAYLTCSPGPGENLSLSYYASTTNPTVQQLQPIPDLANPFQVYIGNQNLVASLKHNLNVNFTVINTRTLQNLQMLVQISMIQHEITPSTSLLAGGVQQIQYVNVNGPWSINGHMAYGFPLGDQQKSNTSINLRLQYAKDISQTNGLLDVTTSQGASLTWKVNYHPLNRLFLETIAALNYSSSQYSINDQQNAQTWLQTYSTNVSFEFPGQITASTYFFVKKTAPQGTLPATTVNLWNASVSKEFLKNRQGQIRLSAFSILNTAKNSTQSIGVNYLQTQQSNLPGRILLLSFIYHFKPHGKTAIK